MSKGVKENDTLTCLDLSDNMMMGNQAVKYISQTLILNQSLKSIELGHTGISDEGLIEIIKGLKQNYTLTFLEFFTGNVDLKTNPKMLKIRKYITRNQNIQENKRFIRVKPINFNF